MLSSDKKRVKEWIVYTCKRDRSWPFKLVDIITEEQWADRNSVNVSVNSKDNRKLDISTPVSSLVQGETVDIGDHVVKKRLFSYPEIEGVARVSEPTLKGRFIRVKANDKQEVIFFPLKRFFKVKVKCKFCDEFVSPYPWICRDCLVDKVRKFVDYYAK